MLTTLSASAFVLFREGFEIFLIMLLSLNMVQDEMRRRIIWRAFYISIIHAVVLGAVLSDWLLAKERLEQWEGVMYLITAAVMLWVAWFCHNAKQHVESLPVNRTWLLGVAVFGIVLREGIEIVLFLLGIFVKSTQWLPILLGSVLGLTILAVIIVLTNKQIKRFPVMKMFQTSKYIFTAMAVYFAYEGLMELI